jgi:polysaccharide deacetylase 2 family uncharacterized protein YibQ
VKRFSFLAVVIAAALIAAVFLFLERVDQRPDGEARKESGTEAPEKASEADESKPGAEPGPTESEHPARSIAVIIDDIGFDLRVVEELAAIQEPIAFAILPGAPHAREAAELLHTAGKEILLHLQMEPRLYPKISPGAGALMSDMQEEEIRRLIRENLAAVPHVMGVNNHMGSRFMEDESQLAVVMEELKKKNLFFVDSRTTADSRARESARRAGVRFAEREVFIDAVPGYAAALESLTGALKKTKKSGRAVLMIGHPHKETVRAIHNALTIFKEEGVKVIPVSTCIKISEREKTGIPSGNGQSD